MLKETKSTVVRLTDTERSLIQVIRDIGLGEVRKAFKVAVDVVNDDNSQVFKVLETTLNRGSYLNTLKDESIVSQQLYKEIKDSLNKGDSLVISGKVNTGKTTLMRSILMEEGLLEGKNVAVMDRGELVLGYGQKSSTGIQYINLSSLSVRDLCNIFLRHRFDVLVFGEITHYKELLLVSQALSFGIQVIFEVVDLDVLLMRLESDLGEPVVRSFKEIYANRGVQNLLCYLDKDQRKVRWVGK